MDGLITVFGGGGFLGRYVVQELLAAGARVRVAERDPRRALFLKPLGGLGQSQFIAADVTKPASVARAVAGAGAVINLVGILKGDFDRLHVTGATNIAEAAAAAGVGAFVHVSAIGADPASPSHYGRSKGQAEARVRAVFPQATMLRPSILFGAEDQFVNRFARMAELLPVVPVIRPEVRLQPAWAGDVGRAVALAAVDPGRYGGQLFELGGPQALTMQALVAWIAAAIGRTPTLLPVPDAVTRSLARFGGTLPGAPITWDQWLMLQQDNVVHDGVPGFAAFDIAPAPLAAVAPRWLVRFRKHGRFGIAQAA